jgi:hypothetical protein
MPPRQAPLAEGLVGLIGRTIRPNRERLVCQEPAGALYAAERPATWTDAEEAAYVAEAACVGELRRWLLGALILPLTRR